MPMLNVMGCVEVLVFAFLAGIGWHAGTWATSKLLK